jgi:predicted Fe-Mo cluster-binding NifX family protein
MRFAVLSEDPPLSWPITARFGRCPCVIIAETGDPSVEANENPHAEALGGVGRRLVGLLAARGGGVVLTHDCGPAAEAALNAANLALVEVSAATPREAIAEYLRGSLDRAEPGSHHRGVRRKRSLGGRHRRLCGTDEGPAFR